MEKYTQEQAKALPFISHATAEKAYKIIGAGIVIPVDNKDGMGEVPDNRNVLYKGFVVHMSPATFLSLVRPSVGTEKQGEKIARRIRSGSAIGNPFLELDIKGFFDHDNYAQAIVVDHEGRNRVAALASLGVLEFPVHVFLSGRYRAKDVKDAKDFIDYLQAGIVSQTNAVVKNALAGDILF